LVVHPFLHPAWRRRIQKTDSETDRAATARYHASNNVFFLEAAMHGRYEHLTSGWQLVL
jgi:hypothetical protein